MKTFIIIASGDEDYSKLSSKIIDCYGTFNHEFRDHEYQEDRGIWFIGTDPEKTVSDICAEIGIKSDRSDESGYSGIVIEFNEDSYDGYFSAALQDRLFAWYAH